MTTAREAAELGDLLWEEVGPMTEPRTEAGGKLLDWIDEWQQMDAYPHTVAMIRAVEDEAQQPDVDRLADFIRDKIESEPYQGLHPELASMGLAIAIRDEFLNPAWQAR